MGARHACIETSDFVCALLSLLFKKRGQTQWQTRKPLPGITPFVVMPDFVLSPMPQLRGNRGYSGA